MDRLRDCVGCALMSVAIAVGCHDGKNDKPVTRQNGIALATVEHDGHQFVAVGSGLGAYIIHHPSCPCLKEAEKK